MYVCIYIYIYIYIFLYIDIYSNINEVSYILYFCIKNLSTPTV